MSVEIDHFTDALAKATVTIVRRFGWGSVHPGMTYWQNQYIKMSELLGSLPNHEIAFHKWDTRIAHGMGGQHYKEVADAIMNVPWMDDRGEHINFAEMYHLLKGAADGVGVRATRVHHVDAAMSSDAIVAKLKRKPVGLRYRLIARLERSGWEQIGSGYFSVVYGKGTQAIKVSKMMDEWPAYVKWAKEQGFAGTLAPNVHSMKLYRGAPGEEPFYVARMDRLASTVAGYHRKNKDELLEEVSALSDLLHHKGKIPKLPKGATRYEAHMFKAKEQFYRENYGNMLPFAEAFGKKFGSEGLDLHLNNYMVTEDGKLVLTDPLSTGSSNYKDTSKYRIKSTERMAA